MENHVQGPTLRDKFATAAMQGLLSSDAEFSREDYPKTVDLIAETAYEQADAMLKARENRPHGIQVLINVPAEIEFVQMIEKQIDAALVNCGFSRTTTSKGGDYTELDYQQFGRCL